jgi:hypothetical protein
MHIALEPSPCNDLSIMIFMYEAWKGQLHVSIFSSFIMVTK